MKLARLIRTHWLPVLLGILLLIVSLFLWRLTALTESQHIQNLVNNESDHMVFSIKDNVTRGVNILKSVVARWQRQGKMTKQAWEQYVNSFSAGVRGIQAIEWVDKDYIVRWISPLRGNEAALNLNLAFEARRKKALELSRREKKIRMTQVVNLVQGGKGVLIYVPLYVNKKFNGFILGVFNIDKMLLPVFTDTMSDGFAFILHDNEEVIRTSQINTLHTAEKWVTTKQINLYGKMWELKVWPTQKLLQDLKTYLPLFLLISGIAFSLLLVFLLILLGEFRRRAALIQARSLALTELQEGYQLLLESVTEGIYGLDLQGNVTFVNSAVEGFLGYSKEELIGKSMHELTHHSYSDGRPYLKEHCKIYASFQDGQMHRVSDEVMWCKDGRSIPVEYASNPIEKKGVLVGVVVTFSDITERLHAEEQLKRKIGQIGLLYQITRLLSEETSFEKALQETVNMVCVTQKWPVGHVYVPAIDGRLMLVSSKIWYCQHGLDIEEFRKVTEHTTFEPGIGLPGRIWVMKQPAWIEDVQEDPNFPRAKICKDLKLHAAVGFPIIVSGRIMAVLEFFSDVVLKQDDAFLDLFSALGLQLSRTFEKREIEQTIQSSEAKYRAVIKNAVDAIIIIDQSGIVQECNDAVSKIFGYKKEAIVGNNVSMLMAEPYQSEHDAYLKRYRETGRSKVIGAGREVVGQSKSGETILLHLSVSEIEVQGQVQYVGILRDITEEKRVTAALHDSEERTRLLLASVGEGVYGLDLEGRATFVNPAAACMLGYDEKELIGQSMHALIHYNYPDGTPYPREDCPIYAVFADGKSHRVSGEVLWRKDGSSFPVGYVSTPIFRSKKLVGAVVAFSDISKQQEANRKLESLAHYDYLTELPNHALFDETLEKVISREGRRQSEFALLYIDVDNFKQINDQFGHQVGDQVLVEVAKRLKASVRVYDIVARLSGDEFALILQDSGVRSDVEKIANKIIQAMQEECYFDRKSVTVSVSIGVALYPDDGDTGEILLRHADMALYEAKAKNRGGCQFFGK